MGIHNRLLGLVFVPGATFTAEIESVTGCAKRQHFPSVCQAIHEVVTCLGGRAVSAIDVLKHSGQLALAGVMQSTANAQVDVKGPAVRAERIARLGWFSMGVGKASPVGVILGSGLLLYFNIGPNQGDRYAFRCRETLSGGLHPSNWRGSEN